MEKIWKDGRIVTQLNENEREKINNIFEKDIPSNKEIIELLKMIIEILTS